MSTSTTTWHGVDLRWAYADLLNGIHRRTGCMHRAQDILHDALVRMALVRRSSPIPQPHAYLRTVVSHLMTDRFREDARWVDCADESGNLPDSLLGAGPSAEHLADLNDRLRTTQRILDCLPPRCRQVFWLFGVEGYTQPEIAASLGISLKVVEYHVMRAMLDMRAACKQLLS